MNTLSEIFRESDRINEEPPYEFETLGALALAKPVAESTKFNWQESPSVDGTKKFWSSGEGVFQIEKELKEGIQYPFRLIMHVMTTRVVLLDRSILSPPPRKPPTGYGTLCFGLTLITLK